MMDRDFLIPNNMAELRRDLSRMTPDSKIVGGGTDLTIDMRNGRLSPDILLYLGDIEDLRAIYTESGCIRVGANATMHEIAVSGIFGREYGAITDAAAEIGSRQVRNLATIGGNIAGASPGADMLPVLFLHKAELEIASPEGLCRKPVSEVVLSPGRTSLKHNEAITAIYLPPPPCVNYNSVFVKLGYRQKVTISRISLAVGLAFDIDGTVTFAEVVAGAISDVPVHVKKAEQILYGSKITPEIKTKAGEALSALIKELTPGKDYKISAAMGIAEDALNRF